MGPATQPSTQSQAGTCLYLYEVMDIYSRKVVGWQAYKEESSALATEKASSAAA